MKKVLLFAVSTLVLFTGCFAAKTGNNIKVKVNGVDNVSLDYTIVDNSNVILSAKNTIDKAIDYVTVNMAVYDKTGKLVEVEKQYLRNLLANQESVIKVSLTDVATSEEDVNIAKIEMSVKTVNYENNVETAYTDKVEGKVEKAENEGQLNLTITNNSGVTLDDLSASVVFYKDSKIVDLYSVSAQKVDATYTDTVYIPVHNSDTEATSFIKYDDVKVVINNASVFNQ